MHQEILLAPDLTVAQNLFLGREIRRGLDGGRPRRCASQCARGAWPRSAPGVEPDALVGRLSIAQRQLVQIARVLLVPHRVVIFDEPTASLTPHETDALLRSSSGIRAKGAAVLYISHRLPEVKTIADRVTVLRDGRLVATARPRSWSRWTWRDAWWGATWQGSIRTGRTTPGRRVLTCAVLGAGSCAHASFELRRGEILGFAGLVGAGRTELMEGIVGLRPGRGGVTWTASP